MPLTGRDEQRKKSLDALRRIAEESQAQPWLKKKPPANPKRDPPRMSPVAPEPARGRTAGAPAPRGPAAPRPKRDPEFEGKAAKQAEERRLRELRARQLSAGATAKWRGMGWGDVPASIRRTPFDTVEPSVSQKIADVLGDTKEKEGRAKARDKGRRQGGR